MRFNPYKAQRQLDRRSKSWQHTGAWFKQLIRPQTTGGRYHNPLHHNQAPKKWPMPVLFTTIGVLIGILFWHPFFTIRLVSVTGTTRVASPEVAAAAEGIMDRTRWFILPGNNFFLVNTTEIANILTQRFPFYRVSLKKQFPNQLHIEAQEKEPVLIFDNGREYSYVDPSGQVIKVLEKVGESEWHFTTAVAPTSTPGATSTLVIVNQWHEPAAKRIVGSHGFYPILYHVAGPTTTPNSQAVTLELVTNVLTWQERLDNGLGEPGALYFQQDNDRGEGSIRTRAGWSVKVRLLEDPNVQIERLELALRTIKNQNVKFNYVDVRFAGKVFWQ